MQRRQFFQGAGVLAVASVAPLATHASDLDGASSLLKQLNKKRLLLDIRSRYEFGNELVLTDVNEREGQLFVSVKHKHVRFQLRSPDRGMNWHTV